VIKAEQTGELLAAIAESGDFKVSGVFSIHMTLAMGEELFEVYRGLYLNYTAMLEHMCSAPVLAVMVTGGGAAAHYEDVVSSFREFVGPSNPALAKVLRPESLRYDLFGSEYHLYSVKYYLYVFLFLIIFRARFGNDITHNAVHCTDLPEDGEMECRYFFQTLASL
jgi:nucleoside-diphosphate kinase